MEEYIFTINQWCLRDWQLENNYNLSMLDLFILNDFIMSYRSLNSYEIKDDSSNLTSYYIRYNPELLIERYPILPITSSEVIACYLNLVNLGLIIEKRIKNNNSYTGFTPVYALNKLIPTTGPLYPEDYLEYKYEEDTSRHN